MFADVSIISIENEIDLFRLHPLLVMITQEEDCLPILYNIDTAVTVSEISLNKMCIMILEISLGGL